MEPQASSPPQPEISLDESALMLLKGAASWAKFLAIVGFVFIGIMLISMLSASYLFNRFMLMPGLSGFYVLIYLIIAIIYFFPMWFLFRFAVKTQRAIDMHQSQELTLAFTYLKSFYQYLGILTIITIALYVIMMIGMIIGFQMMNQ
ncbi:MAG: hypothetical protein K6T34_03460 [Thermoflavifilum sp.]|nr:hypothetical protein [Thermoflavifilum sp.]